jgi:hypothetical protein
VAIHFPILENNTSETINLESFSVTVSQIDPLSFRGFEFTMVPSDNLLLVYEINSTDVLAPPSSVSLSIPSSLFANVTLPPSPTGPRITNVVYRSDALFDDATNADPGAVVSVVASATLSLGSQIISVDDLNPPITLNFSIRDDIQVFGNFTCNFWDFSGNGEMNAC